MRLTLRSLSIGATLVLGLGLILSLRRGAEEPAVAPMPLVLQKVQALGELRTARFTYQHVFEHKTSRQPQEWASVVPGMASLVRSSTTNSGLVSATAQVDAGVDLSQARMEGSTLVVPRASVYRPVVDARMHQVRRGLFWRDENLAFNAVSTLESRVKTAAVEQGILREAEANALKQVRALVGPERAIEFR